MCILHPHTDAELVNVLDLSDTVKVNGGQFTVSIQGGMPKVYHPSSGDSGDGVERGGGEGGEGEEEDTNQENGHSSGQFNHFLSYSNV